MREKKNLVAGFYVEMGLEGMPECAECRKALPDDGSCYCPECEGEVYAED